MASAPAASSDPTTSSPPPSTKPFRFKSRKRHSPPPLSHTETAHERTSLSPPSSHPQNPGHAHRHRHRHRHRHHHHQRSKRRRHSPSPDPQRWDVPSAAFKDPDAAFRESLFDALADDEGAAFWEGVYGQPIHRYSPYYPASQEGEDPDRPKLERMSDAEYTAYVRGKMWERSHEHIVEERRRREEERKRKKLDEEEGRRWQRGVEEALRRGEERRKRNRWKGVWEGYLQGWGKLCPAGFGEGTAGGSWKDVIVWPVESGKWEDVEREQVERFFRHAPGGVAELGDLLKKERVRWHPDKMQQRAGSGGIGVETLKLVTAVFQVVDRLWSETKNRA